MARGALKNVPRRRPADRQKETTAGIGQMQGGALLDELDSMNGWLTCECLFSFTLVFFLLLAAIPFNLYSSDLYQTRDFFVLKAEEHAAAGAYATAATLFEKAVRVDETADGHMFLADTLVRAGRAGAAVTHYQRASDLYSLVEDERNQTSALTSLGKVYLEQLQRPDLAVYTYRHAIEISTKDAGLVQPSTSGFLGAGIDSSTGSNNLQPTSDLAEAHFQTARALLTGASQANYVITGAQSTGYIRIKSNTEDLAPDSLWAGAHTTAIAHLEAATVVQPSHAAAHLLLANLWRDLGAPDKAIARYKKVIKYRARDVESLLALGLAHLELGNVKQALVVFNKVSNLVPNGQFPELAYWACALGDNSSQMFNASNYTNNSECSNMSSGSRAVYAWQQRAAVTSALNGSVNGEIDLSEDNVTAAAANNNTVVNRIHAEIWPAHRAPPAYVKRLFDLEAKKAFAHRAARVESSGSLPEAGVKTTSRFFEVHGLGVHRSGWASMVLAELVENVMEASSYRLPVPTSRLSRQPKRLDIMEKARVTLNESAVAAGWSAHVSASAQPITAMNGNARYNFRNPSDGMNPSTPTADASAASTSMPPLAVLGWAGPFVVNRGGFALLDVLDLGCGRGRAGALLKGLANHLVGIDLSKRALEENAATLPGVYDELVLGDVELMFDHSTNHQAHGRVDEDNEVEEDSSSSSSSGGSNSNLMGSRDDNRRECNGSSDCNDNSNDGWLQDGMAGSAPIESGSTRRAVSKVQATSMDLVVAADTAPYFGSLTMLFRGSMRLLRPGGCFAFTMDLLPPCLPPVHGHSTNHSKHNMNSRNNRHNMHHETPKRSSSDGTSGALSSLPYDLQPTGRWAHTWAYVEAQVLAAGFTIAATRGLNTTAHFAAPKSEKVEAPRTRMSTGATSLPDGRNSSDTTRNGSNSSSSIDSGWLREVPQCALAVVLQRHW